jgi:hypothetical protein
MNSDELHSCARKFLAENFGLTLEIPIRISKRMKSKLGAFQIKYQKQAGCFERNCYVPHFSR